MASLLGRSFLSLSSIQDFLKQPQWYPLELGAILFVTLLVMTTLVRKRSKLPPGPLCLPIFGNWLQVGNDLNHRNLAKMAKSYGDVFMLRLGCRNLVVVSNPELAKQVLHTQGVEFGSRKNNLVFDIFTGNGQDMVFTVYGEHWRKMRRIMTLPFFTQKVVQHYRGGWEEEIQRVVEDVRANKVALESGIVIRKRLQLMLYNILYTMMFDRRFESQEDPLFVQATAFNAERSQLAQSFEYNYGDFIPILRPFLRGYLNKCTDLQSRRLAFFNDHFIQERRKILAKGKGDEKVKKCAIDHILEAESKGEINEQNVLYIVENINVAAIETTLWSMEWALAELVNHPEVQAKVRSELERVVGKGEEVKEEDVEKLPYLQAVVKETLRLHTPIPLLVPHMNLGEASIDGFRIPQESKVVVNAWWLSNNPEWWRNPSEFRPDRFMEEEEETEAAVGGKVDFRFLPFGMGRRSCPGIILALPLLGLVIGRILNNFEMLPPPGEQKIDVGEKGGQFSLHIARHSTVRFHPL
ncbi:trans-cinnamate 4-monooxygenase C4H2 [Cryptomeria japonica]|uniref:trans-cinnamate 4-monooxygenase C4H2 n=1 Tax=Cryptomeria japonica TaxID=3369 RepID=UPI0027DA7E3E|nr:trans-cinnamate 4-monooxygenase C4H2 [Cryptomeria japonica]